VVYFFIKELPPQNWATSWHGFDTFGVATNINWGDKGSKMNNLLVLVHYTKLPIIGIFSTRNWLLFHFHLSIKNHNIYDRLCFDAFKKIKHSAVSYLKHQAISKKIN